MPTPERDRDIIMHILRYCDEIEEAHREYKASKQAFISHSAYRNAVALCVLQIGELSNHLSDEFKTEYSQIPWREIRGMRNIVAHRYGNVDFDSLWVTVCEDVPRLRGLLKSIDF